MSATIHRQFQYKTHLLMFLISLLQSVYYDNKEKCFKDKEYDLYWSNKIDIRYNKKRGFILKTQFVK